MYSQKKTPHNKAQVLWLFPSYTADLTMDVIARVALGLQLDNQTAESGESEFSTVAKQILDVKITNPIIICAGKSVLTFDTMKTESCPDANFVDTGDDILSGVGEPGHHMMTSSNGNIFRVTVHLCGEFTGPRWIPRTKASDAERWCFLCSASE